MGKIIFTGTGAAPGVPSLSRGWGNCDPNNEKNRRRRIGTYLEIGNQKFLIDTSPDLRAQLLENEIRYVDGVLYTHAHADHIHGIDDLRELNRIIKRPLNVYGTKHTIDQIRTRFSYLVADPLCTADRCIYKASLAVSEIGFDESLYLGDVKIDVLELTGHLVPSNGYIFNDGEVVYVADCQEISEVGLKKIKVKPKVLVLPLTTPNAGYAKISHMGLDKVLEYVNVIKPERAILNHMAAECDYDEISRLTPSNVFVAFDNMVVEY